MINRNKCVGGFWSFHYEYIQLIGCKIILQFSN
jgi:hypothetical protein